MNLEEAIKHCETKAENLRATEFIDNEQYTHCLKCAAEHEQLAEWLEELKERRAKHNGYANYPTWLIRTTLNNTKETYLFILDLCEEQNYNKYAIADKIKTYAQTDVERLESQLIKNLLLYLINDVIDWKEIAEAFILDLCEEAFMEE